MVVPHLGMMKVLVRFQTWAPVISRQRLSRKGDALAGDDHQRAKSVIVLHPGFPTHGETGQNRLGAPLNDEAWA
jgi:hypothetical protein